jgi:hypothetical protein
MAPGVAILWRCLSGTNAAMRGFDVEQLSKVQSAMFADPSALSRIDAVTAVCGLLSAPNIITCRLDGRLNCGKSHFSGDL